MKVFIQKIKGRERVRIRHGNQIFTIDDYNGYKSGKEIEWLQNCVERFFAAYDESVKQPPTCNTCGFFDGSGWCMKHKVSVGVKQTCPDYYESTEQPEAIAGEKTIEDILSSCISGELKKGDFVYEDEAIKAMQIYASQQTAFKDQKITELTNLLSDTNKRIQEIQDEEELKDKQLQVQQSHIDDQDQLIFEQGKEIKELKEENRKLLFMIENGLGPDDLKNDITMPHEI